MVHSDGVLSPKVASGLLQASSLRFLCFGRASRCMGLWKTDKKGSRVSDRYGDYLVGSFPAISNI